jgi:Flp pilus assembly pilin Flp
MAALSEHIRRFLQTEDATTSLEYMVKISLIVVVCLVAIVFVGTTSGQSYSDSANKIVSSGS